MAATFLSAKVVYMAITKDAETTTTMSNNFSITMAMSIAKTIFIFLAPSY
jgi:hypothetical protein